MQQDWQAANPGLAAAWEDLQWIRVGSEGMAAKAGSNKVIEKPPPPAVPESSSSDPESPEPEGFGFGQEKAISGDGFFMLLGEWRGRGLEAVDAWMRAVKKAKDRYDKMISDTDEDC